jgi:hypothetical protein
VSVLQLQTSISTILIAQLPSILISESPVSDIVLQPIPNPNEKICDFFLTFTDLCFSNIMSRIGDQMSSVEEQQTTTDHLISDKAPQMCTMHFSQVTLDCGFKHQASSVIVI